MEAEMNKRLQASIRAMTEAQAKAYYARLLAENKLKSVARFARMWKLVRRKNLIEAPISYKPKGKMGNALRFLRIQHLVIGLILAVVVGTWALWFKKVDPVYSFVEQNVKAQLVQTFPKPACDNPTAVLGWTSEGRAYPATDELHYGRWIEIKQFNQWIDFWKTSAGRIETSTKLAERMLPVSGFDFYDAFVKSLDFTIKMGKPCLEVPDPFPTLTARIVNAETGNSTGNEAESYSPTILPTPVDVVISEDPVLAPTVIPKPTTAPIPTPTPVGVLKFVDDFTKGLEEVKTSCWAKFQPDVVEASACENILGRNLRIDNKDVVLADIQSSANPLCSQNLGIVSWNDITTGINGIWAYSNTFNVFGEPGNLSLVADTAGEYICALTQNSTSIFNGKLWLTVPNDPFFPGYGSEIGYGVISLGALPNELSVQTGNVYVWPTR
ncbi:hypothetical protein A3H26_02470 [candidate division WWE3 bacterium RIFCSPLOWO2_12_FULL_36_10]|uniref:Uncharacterized protein n=1 Tax=candidate division WWE3 bacterium RIFCSPLOWO2_12_FULL_36_10 TaxID=1802630 RepID=A0A1F4VJ22_UNCKA|nr:MAG: hypothetical protein A3H26_02470 [candidate division WWE3 bacterium RIFCSPLOWO2_12_FULL_36_10]